MKIMKSDLVSLEKVAKVTDHVFKLYKQLYDLEIRGLKESNEYKKVLGHLSVIIDIEIDYYNKANLDLAKSQIWHEYLNMMTDVSEFDDEKIINRDYNNIEIGRIQNNLFLIITEDFRYVSNSMSSFNVKLLDNYIISSGLDFTTFDIYSMFEFNLERNIRMAFLFFLEECIHDSKYKNIFDELVRAKYNFIFVNKDVEELLMKCNFDLSNILCTDIDLLAKQNYVDNDLKNLIIKRIAEVTYLENIKNILLIDDVDYNDKYKFLSSVLRQCFIKASLLLLNEYSIKELECSFDDNSNNYINSNISKSLVKQCFKDINKDKSKIKIYK